MADQTPKRRGGARPGAGRKPGGRNALPLGTVGAINAAKLADKRLGGDPSAADPDVKAAVTRAMQRVADVLEEKVGYQEAGGVLKAAAFICDAAAGKQVERVAVAEVSYAELVEASMVPEPKPVEAPAIIVRKKGGAA